MTRNDPAARLNGDLLPWERQPSETEGAYQAFEAWLHSEKRRVIDHGASARNWSMRYHWAARAHEYDIYISRVDLEDQVRYRRKMNARHRQMASVAQSKLVQWLNTLDEAKIAKMSTADATRLLDVAVRIERAAVSGVGPEDLPDPYSEPPRENGSLEQRLIDAGLGGQLSDIANLLHKRLDPPRDRVEGPTEELRHGGPSHGIWGQAVDDPAPDIFGSG
jgi:hypothetical protein